MTETLVAATAADVVNLTDGPKKTGSTFFADLGDTRSQERNVIEGKYHPEILKRLVESAMVVGGWVSPPDAAQVLAAPVRVYFVDRGGELLEELEDYREEIETYFEDNGQKQIGGVEVMALVNTMDLDSAAGEAHRESIKARSLENGKREAIAEAMKILSYRRGGKSEEVIGVPGGVSAELRLHRAARGLENPKPAAVVPKWQKCPVCEGQGTVDPNPNTDPSLTARHVTPCSVCAGKKIINAETGLPPQALALEVKVHPQT